MALTVTKTVLTRFTPEIGMVKCAVTFDNSYATGGEALSVADKLKTVDCCFVQDHGGTGYFIDPVTISGATITLRVMYGDYSASSDGPHVQVPDTTDIHTLTCTVIAIGKLLG